MNRYTNKAINVQGESIVLKLLMIEILTGVLPYKEAIALQLDTIEVEATSDQVLDGLREVIPSAYTYLDETSKAIIAPSIVLRTFNVDLKDFAYILYPVLRGLEGLVKKMFNDKGITIGDNFGGYVSYSNDTDAATVHSSQVTNFTSGQIQAIQIAYRYYKKNRHGLFHVDGTINTTRLVETKEEALEILGEVFDTLNLEL